MECFVHCYDEHDCRDGRFTIEKLVSGPWPCDHDASLACVADSRPCTDGRCGVELCADDEAYVRGLLPPAGVTTLRLTPPGDGELVGVGASGARVFQVRIDPLPPRSESSPVSDTSTLRKTALGSDAVTVIVEDVELDVAEAELIATPVRADATDRLWSGHGAFVAQLADGSRQWAVWELSSDPGDGSRAIRVSLWREPPMP